ncbi:MAG TPA: hypothetical protein VFE38_01545 [Edaphobacter sp.]|nr:hypothetical protein [Edaphobacter sp.]
MPLTEPKLDPSLPEGKIAPAERKPIGGRQIAESGYGERNPYDTTGMTSRKKALVFHILGVDSHSNPSLVVGVSSGNGRAIFQKERVVYGH